MRGKRAKQRPKRPVIYKRVSLGKRKKNIKPVRRYKVPIRRLWKRAVSVIKVNRLAMVKSFAKSAKLMLLDGKTVTDKGGNVIGFLRVGDDRKIRFVRTAPSP